MEKEHGARPGASLDGNSSPGASPDGDATPGVPAPAFNGEQFVAGVMTDIETSALSNSEKVLFRFVEKVNHDSPSITADDMLTLYTAGYDDEAIWYAITVCSLFNFYNRWIDASGVHPLSDEAHRQGGLRSASMGYVRE